MTIPVDARRFHLLLVAISWAFIVQAQARWLSTEHDFGAFDEEDGKVKTEFKFINEGGTPLRIDHVSSSCGCTVPEYSKSSVNQGDTASVTVAYNPSGRPGRFSKSLKVKLSNDSVKKLIVKGVVIGSQNTLRSRFPLAYGPLRLRGDMITFGSVKSGKITSKYIEVYNSSRQPVVPQWSGIPEYLRITTAHDTIPPGEQGVYSLVVSPGKSTPFGLLTDSVSFSIDGQPPLSIQFAAIVEEDFSLLTERQLADAPRGALEPDRLDFGDFTPGQGAVTRKLKITNTGKNELILRRVYTTEKGIKVKTSGEKIKRGKSATIEVTFNPDEFSAPLLNSRLQIITNDPSCPVTTVRLIGINLKSD